MTITADYKRLRRLTTIYLVIQLFLVVLLVYMAGSFQAGLQAEGRPQRFLHSVVAALVLQVALFYPIKKFAGRVATREIEGCAPGLDAEKLKSLRNRRMVDDVVKSGVFIFFITFIYRAPQDRFVLSFLFISFILTFISYFQCLSFAIKKGIPPKG